MKHNDFVVLGDVSMRHALSLIESNQHGFILTMDKEGSISGLATDGDIRRYLLKGGTLTDPIEACVNRDFFWDTPQASRESLIKKLDNRIRCIPILDHNRRLVNLITRNHLPVPAENSVYARASAPVRMSFGGGGSDLTHYFSEINGAVISTAISLYSHSLLKIREDSKISVTSRDLRKTYSADSLSVALNNEENFGLILAVLKVINPEFGFDLFLNSDFKIKSGLGGSAAVAVSIIGCFNQFRQDQWDQYEMAELAYQAERLYLGVAGGWQDQYASVFGGFNFIEFRMDQNIVHPLRIHADTLLELEESLVLCDTNTSHDSGEIHQDQYYEYSRDEVRNYVRANVEISYKIRNALLRGRLIEFGQSLNDAWNCKREFSRKISNAYLDTIYETARLNGALGGKLLGAGGGGFFIFYVSPLQKYKLMTCLESLGLRLQTFRFEREGIRMWTVRACPTDDYSDCRVQ